MNQNNSSTSLPEEVTLQIFSQLDIQSLCRASMTCRSWNDIIRNNDGLWKPHCLALRAVCEREVDDDRKSGYSWRDTLLRNYKKSQVKHSWLSGRFSNIDLPTLLSETTMCPMDKGTWGEILEAELNRSEIKNDGRVSGCCTPKNKLE
ncbi:PREDICTED: F-box only protein 48-like [Myotis davidii]|uniref:F-box only protein 48-like n=1 Tax=Myotis davidii TaxID=225400 RepID=UPI000767B832|nr:PREDICTED: F-box only protein 48-like [Myotis davidii]